MEARPGLELKLWRVRQGLKLADVAELLRCSLSHLAAIEAGTGSPGRELAIRIEDRTGISVRDWIARRSSSGWGRLRSEPATRT